MLSTQMIGKKITEARKKRMISQAQLATQLFISSQAVGKWERGESLPDIITLNRLAEILEVDLNYFSEVGSIATAEKQVEIVPSSLEQKKTIKWDMSRGNWVDADFSGLKDLHEKFSSSNMQRCKFVDSNLTELLLSGNHLDTCDFSGADLSNSRIQRSYFANNQFAECRLNNAEFLGSYVSDSDFTGADLTGLVFKSGGFEKNNLTDSVWNRTSFVDSQLVNLVIEGKLENCYFDNCSFKRVTFQQATLTNTFFKNKHFKSVQFIECKVDRITYEFLKAAKTDLTGITVI